MTIRVLVADDQPLVCSALSTCLSAEPDIDVVGEASDGYRAIDLARALRPDVVVMDIRMPNLSGLAATRAVTELSVKVLIITTFDSTSTSWRPCAPGRAGSYSKTSRLRNSCTRFG
jgi:DNA-binding NarL/FixJ family response regulator